MNADGHIRINTRLDNSKIKQDLKELNKLIEDEAKLKTRKQEIEIDIADYERQLKELEDLREKYLKIGNKDLASSTGQQIDFLKTTESASYEKNKQDLEEINFLLKKNVEEQARLNGEIQKAEYDKIKGSIGEIGKSVKNLTKKVLKWGLAILSVRSAYMLIRQTASTLSQYNDELKNKIEGIRLSLASALEPVITKIVDLIIELLRYVNAISVSLFGWDLFANAKNMKSMSKSAKEIKNSLAGFDEMNVLADASSGASGSGTVGIDLSPKDLDGSIFYEWIDKAKEILFKGFDAIKNNIVKVFEELQFPSFLIDSWLASFEFIKGAFSGLLTSVKGALEILVGFFTGDAEKVKEGFKTMIEGIKMVFFSYFNWVKNLIDIGIDFVLTSYKKLWEGIKKIFSTVGSFFEGIWNTIKSKFTKIGTSIGEAVSSAFKTVINSVITFAQNTINKFIKAINKAIGVINVIPGVNIKKITEINIPKLATGGIVNRPTYAQIGEAGREAVLPLDRNTEWMNELAKKINSNGGVVNVYLDGRLIQRQYNQRQEEFNFATNGGA